MVPTDKSSSGKSSSGERLSFEEALEKLQSSVKKLESGELSLEKSLQEFEEGIRLTRLCQEYLSSAEQRIEVLMKTSSLEREDKRPEEKTESLEFQPFATGRA